MDAGGAATRNAHAILEAYPKPDVGNAMRLRNAVTAVTCAGIILAGGPAWPASASPPPVIRAGDMIRLALVEFGCTTGLTFTHTKEVVTAAHCAPTPHGFAYRDFSPTPIGRIVNIRKDLDFAAIEVHGPVADTPVAPPPAVGTEICKIGRMTGRTCGPVTKVTDTEVWATLRLLPGDSGGRGVVAVQQDGHTQQVAVGIVSKTLTPQGVSTVLFASLLGRPVSVVFMRADRIKQAMGA